MRPFLTTFTLAATAAAGLWWHQHGVIAGLEDELAAQPAAAPATPAPTSKPKPARKKKEPKVLLRNPDGTPMITSRSALRGALDAAKYVRTLSREALEKILLEEEPDDMGEAGGLGLAGWARLGELDPRSALALAAKAKEKDEGFYIVLYDWLIRDRAAAITWFHEQKDSEQKANFLGVAGLVLASSDPDLLGQLTGSIEDPELQRKSVTQSIIAQSATDPDAAIARYRELTDAETRKDVLEGLFVIHNNNRPRELMDLALPEAMQSKEQPRMLGMLLQNDFTKNPGDALNWLVSRSPEEVTALRKGSSGLNINAVGNLDTPTVQAAAARLEKPEDREWLLTNYYAGHARTEPLSSLEAFSRTVSDPVLRPDGLDYILSASVRSGREAELEPWLAVQPEKEQAALRTKMAKWKANAGKP